MNELEVPPDAPAHKVVKPCGPCSLCCKLMTVNALNKPGGTWCAHFAKAKGCGIHAERPGECRYFQCYWSISEVLGEEWRPDRAKFVLWSNAEGRIIVEADPSQPAAWKQEPYYSAFKTWSDRRRPLPLEVLIRLSGRMTVVFPEADIEVGFMQTGMKLEVGYRTEDGREVPFAELRAS